ncbi:MAG: toxin TcdB middle/N-terminal domain-containing protein [Candidatus Omnitrophota bacterium]|nr:toxin TcdB middle/N-terminal domain-containing protein [Candidatus Omnitrophota bacterium]
MFKKIISIFLIFLHLAAFGPVREALAFYADSASYRLSGAALNSGGAGRAASSYVLLEDTVGGLCKGEFDGDNYVLDGGFVSAALSGPPVQSKDIPGQLIEVGKDKNNAFNLDDYFESPDGIPLTYAVSGNSKIGVKIDPQTHKVSITPAKNWQGKETVKFIALDSEGNSVESREVTLRAGSGPVIEQIETVPEKIVKKDAVKIKVKVKNLDKKKIKVTYSDSIKEEKSSQDASEAGVWYSQADWQAAAKGIYRIEVTATDSAGLSDSKTISLNVFDTNAPPVLKPIAAINIKEGDLAVVSPSASDSDGDAVSFYYYAPLDDHGQWRTGFDDAGKYTAEVAVSDGRDTVRQTVAIIVENSPRPPDKVGLKVEPATAFMNDTIKITIFPFDPDKEDKELNYSIDKGNGEAVKGKIANNTEYAATVKFDKKGEYSVSATITDNDNLIKTEKIGIDIDDINSSVNPIMGDFDGNGLTDLGVHNYANGEWNICFSVKGEFPSAVPWLANFGGSRDWWPIGGDFDGDGKSDIGIYNWREGQFKAALSTGGGFSAADKWQFSFPEHSEAWRPSTGNFNGDRYTDFIFYNKDDGTIKVALGSSSGFGGFSERPVDLKLKDCAPLSGDFNGDGLTDLCLFNKSSGEFTVFFSNTEKFVEGKSWITGFAKDKDPLAADFNNDGLADIGYWDKDNHNWYYAIATGDRFKEIPEKRVWLDSFGTNNDEVASVGDFNGDGIADAAVFDQDKVGITRWAVKIRKDIKPSGLLTEIDNGMGGKTKITYTYAAESDNKLLPFPVYVTSSVVLVNSVPSGRYASYAQEFVYSDGYFDPVEREFRGFAKVKVTDAASKNYTETYFLQGRSDKDEDGALKGQIKRIAAYDGNLDYYGIGKIISDTVNKYEVKKAGPEDKNLGFPALTEQVATVWHENGSSIETKSKFTYDNFGNVIEAKDEADASKAGVPEVQNAVYKKSTQTVYSLPYELGFNHPLEAVLKDKDGNIISKKAFEYDTKGNLIKDTVFILPLSVSSVNPQTRYSYDLFGNLVSAANAKGAVVTTDYEIIFNTYPQKAVNSLEHTLTYIYEPKFGTLKSTTDANGTVTTSVYDSLGRATSTQINGQPVAMYEYPNFNTKTATNALGLFKTEYIDGLGRKYKTVSSGEDGAVQRNVSSEVFYNDRGQKEKESLPHYADEDVKNIAYTKYVYDIRGRVIKTIADFPGSLKDVESSLNYVNLLYAESTDPGEHRKGVLKDVYGNIIEVTEFTQGGVYKTKYEYDSQNNLTRTIDAQSNAVQIFYDSLGRKIKMIDPDMGIWAYEYDVIGNLIKQTDAKGQVLVFDYDKINRLTKKSLRGAAGDEATEGEARGSAEADRTRPISEYSYDDSTKENCVGRLSKVKDRSGSTEFFYDKLGREVKSIKTIDAVAYPVERAYDDLDRLTALKYPDGGIVN